MAPTKSVFIPIPSVMEQMISQLQASRSPITDLSEGSTGRTLLEAWAITVSAGSLTADELQKDSYLDTATGEALDAQGSNWQVSRLPAVEATGQVEITRQGPGESLVIQAGWGQLTIPPSVPGTEGVAVLTLEDAIFSESATTATVAAQAVLGGTAGNISSGTLLTPVSPIGGVSSSEGYKVATSFTGGVNEESDEAYRARIPLVVQGRVKGNREAFLGASLSVAGVQSANVLGAGSIRGNGSEVQPGDVEVYYQGSAGLLASVESAVDEAATLNQKASAFASISLSPPRGQLRVVLEATVGVLPGVDTTTVKAEVERLAREYVERVGVGGTLYYSELIEAIHQLPEVVTVTLPLKKLALYGEGGAGNIVAAGDSYPNLAEADATITVEEL